MPVLHIDLQEGFDRDAVQVRVNGQQVFDKDTISTRMQIGLADRIQTDVPAGTTNVEVVVPTKHTSTVIPIQIDSEIYLGVSIEERSIVHRINNSPFHYM